MIQFWHVSELSLIDESYSAFGEDIIHWNSQWLFGKFLSHIAFRVIANICEALFSVGVEQMGS